MTTASRATTTMADVARLASVSTATVSRVLNGITSVDPELAKRVIRAVNGTNYVPNNAGRTLRRSRSDLWALIVPDVKNTFFTSIMESFESAAMESGHTVVLCNTKESLELERAYVDQMLAQQVSGVVLAATSVTKSSVQKLTMAGIPVILFDRRMRSFDGDTVVVDNDMVGQLAAEHLLEQGVRRPLIVTGPKTISATVDREVGFRRTFADAELPIPADCVLRTDLMAHPSLTPLASALAEAGPIDAIFAANGPLTSATFRILQDLGWAIPHRVALVGVDDDHWTKMVTPQVTVISQPVREVGRWAARLLDARGSGEAMDPAKVVLEPTLVVRGSSLRRGEEVDHREALGVARGDSQAP